MKLDITKLLNSDSNIWVVVAHPDDETIFCGGTILSYPSISWNIVCVTMQKDTERPIEFRNAMESYKKFGVNIKSYLTLEKKDQAKKGDLLTPEEINDWKKSLNKLNIQTNLVFTHNKHGDYGHNHHMNINSIIHSLFPNVLDFAYPGDTIVKSCPIEISKSYSVHLPEIVLKRKNEIMNDCYRSQSSIWNSRLKFMMDFYFNRGIEVFTSD